MMGFFFSVEYQKHSEFRRLSFLKINYFFVYMYKKLPQLHDWWGGSLVCTGALVTSNSSGSVLNYSRAKVSGMIHP